MKLFPEVDDYKLSFAQALYKSGMYQEAQKACQNLDKPKYQQKIIQLQIAIMYEQDETHHMKSMNQQLGHETSERIIADGCLLYKEDKFEEAR